MILNANSGFDREKLRDIIYKKGIIGNIKENPRNEDANTEIILIKNYIKEYSK